MILHENLERGCHGFALTQTVGLFVRDDACEPVIRHWSHLTSATYPMLMLMTLLLTLIMMLMKLILTLKTWFWRCTSGSQKGFWKKSPEGPL